MKYAEVKSSDLGTKCWSPKRFNDSCHECSMVKQCIKVYGFESAKKGMVTKMKNDASEKYKKAQEDLRKAREYIKEAEKAEEELENENNKS